MKNFKKVLALVLVIASLMGLATMASATKSDDYSDAASITHTEAVDVMSTIGVFDGISGAFSGDSILTREQAAKIITYMILGKDDADALVASVAPYTDVARDRWSAGSIAYCKNAGILAGVGNGRFEPNGKLTGVAFAKMCLVALGYDPNVEGLTGSDWAVNTSKLAIAGAGISANLSQASLADEMTREDACQMAFNTVKADLVDYDDRGASVTVTGGDGKDITISSSPSKAKPVTIETNRVDEKNVVGNIKKETSTVGGSTNLYAGILQFGERYFPKLKQEEGQRDDFGRPTVRWTFKSEEIGNYVCTDQLIQTWTAKAPKGEMHSAIGGAIVDKLTPTATNETFTITTPTGSVVSTDHQLIAYVDGQITSAKTDMDGKKVGEVGDYFKSKSTAAAGYALDGKQNEFLPATKNIGVSGNGVQTELYMDDDANVTIVMVNTYLVKATADYNTANERVNVEAVEIDSEMKDRNGNDTSDTTKATRVDKSFLPSTLSSDDFDVAGVKNGDYLLVRVSYKGKDEDKSGCIETDEKPGVKEVVPATLQTAVVSEYTEHEDVTMGGTKYEYNKILGENENGETFAINSDASIVLDTYGYIMYVDEAVSVNNFVYIDKFGSSSTLTKKAIADAYFTDGTNNEIQISRVDGEGSSAVICGYSGDKYEHWYTFSGNANGQYTLITPNQSRYSQTYQAVLDGTKLVGNETLIKSSAVKFMDKAGSDRWKTTDHELDPQIKNGTNGNDKRAEDLKGNEKTVFVVKDVKGDVNSYTGVANVPTVKLKSTSNSNLVKVSWVERDGYARFVYIDVYGADAVVDEVANAAEYMFTLKSTGNMTHVDGLTYYKYKVVIDGKEEERWISSALVNGTPSDVGRLFYNVKEDSDNRITRGSQTGTDGKVRQFAANMYWNDSDSTISQNGNSLLVGALSKVFNHTSGSTHAFGTVQDDPTYSTKTKGELIANGNSNINLVVGKNVSALLKDSGASYEVYQNVTAGFIGSFLGNYRLSGHVYAVVNENDEDIIDVLWIYVDGIKDSSGNLVSGGGEGKSSDPHPASATYNAYWIMPASTTTTTPGGGDVVATATISLTGAKSAVVDKNGHAKSPDTYKLGASAPDASEFVPNATWSLADGDTVYISYSGVNGLYIDRARLEKKLQMDLNYPTLHLNVEDPDSVVVVYSFEVEPEMKGTSTDITDANGKKTGLGIMTDAKPSVQDNQQKAYVVSLNGKTLFYANALSGKTTDVEKGVYALDEDTAVRSFENVKNAIWTNLDGSVEYRITGDVDLVTAYKVMVADGVSKINSESVENGQTWFVSKNNVRVTSKQQDSQTTLELKVKDKAVAEKNCNANSTVMFTTSLTENDVEIAIAKKAAASKS